MADREYKDINAIAAEMKPLPTPCELAAENDRLMQKASALCKERDELKKTLYEERARHRTEYCESAEYDCVALGKLRKDNERLRHALDQTIVMLNDETVRAERLEAENRAKEQYIAETIGKLARERERDDEIIANLQKELVEAAKERDAAAEDIKKNWLCAVCKKRDKGNEWVGCSEQRIIFEDEYCVTCANFEWRGVQEREERRSRMWRKKSRA